MTAFDAKRRTVAIDFLYLDLEVCTRCRGADANLETALAVEGACCDARHQESCCEPSQKASCCGSSKGTDASACGCR